jgi:hypothetical protein
MRNAMVGFSSVLLGLGCHKDDNSLATEADSVQLGIAHVAGRYGYVEGVNFLSAGVDRVTRTGSSIGKFVLAPNVENLYQGLDVGDASSLAELIDTPAYREVLGGPLSTMILMTFTFNSGVGDGWKWEQDDSFFEREEEEIFQAASRLLVRYANTGKRFVLQNWESDWVIQRGFETDVPKEVRVARMTKWIAARQRGVERARARHPQAGVTVLHAFEVNRVLDEATGLSALFDVLPAIKVDAVSYSAWESFEPVDGRSDAQTVRSRLTSALDSIRRHANGAQLYVGEWGVAEMQFGEQTPDVVDAALSVFNAHHIPLAVYWQVFDNECGGSVDSCRGLWIYRPDGSLGTAAERFASLGLLKGTRH